MNGILLRSYPTKCQIPFLASVRNCKQKLLHFYCTHQSLISTSKVNDTSFNFLRISCGVLITSFAVQFCNDLQTAGLLLILPDTNAIFPHVIMSSLAW